MDKSGKALLLFSEVYKSKGGIPVFNQNFLNAFNNVFEGKATVLSINDLKERKASHNNEKLRFVGCGSNMSWVAKLKFSFLAIYYALFDRPTFVICGHVNVTPLALILKIVLRKNYATIAHGIEVWDIKSWKRRKGLSGSKFIMSVSNYTKERIKASLGNDHSHIIILPDTVDGKRFRPQPRPQYLIDRYGIQDCKTILSITRLEKSEGYKGYDKVIKVLSGVIREVPHVKYILGGSGDDLPRIRNLISQMGLEGKVILAGFIPEEELVDHYNVCDIFVLPSKKEGFGIVFLEALACGVPVIAGSKDGSVDALLNGEVGTLVDPDNLEEIEQAVVNVLKGTVDKRLLESKYLRQRVLEEYGFDKFEKKVQKINAKYLFNDVSATN
jgi:phosphatidylinositol alpha-1,6-mannosyltransferase